ncbi:uncharacterized protein [Antedon mediterranea]|uniref:uncharacterized protein n=1 Tax=Antedon mediterranea TaxID=105859 RepID=UPI003AF81325
MDYSYAYFYVPCLLSLIFCHITECMRIPWRNGGSDLILQRFPLPLQTFRCLDGQLIDVENVCDGYRHCLDDELWCSACSVGTKDGALSCEIDGQPTCVEAVQICDGRRHCDSGIDEHNCEKDKFVSTLARRKRMQQASKTRDLSIIEKKKSYEIPCHPNFNKYCWNGGNCFYIDNPKKRFCLCKTGFEGPRCMHLSPSDYSSY